jgi:hypothetical protein
LALIYSHRVARSNWELASFEDERRCFIIVIICASITLARRWEAINLVPLHRHAD